MAALELAVPQLDCSLQALVCGLSWVPYNSGTVHWLGMTSADFGVPQTTVCARKLVGCNSGPHQPDSG